MKILKNVFQLNVSHYITEHVADRRAKQRKNYDHDDRDQNQNQRIFHKPLAFFFGCEQHGDYLLSVSG
jgi:hypothetical protein